MLVVLYYISGVGSNFGCQNPHMYAVYKNYCVLLIDYDFVTVSCIDSGRILCSHINSTHTVKNIV